jgi:hypothetical protein
MNYFKNDKYRSNRGGYSRLLNIYCRRCNNKIFTYQKDGPGNLRRLYLDRIFSPSILTKLEKINLKELSLLKCKECNAILGTPYIYKKENRKAFKIYQDSIVKKIRKLNE